MDLIEALQRWSELEPVEYLEGRELSVIEYAVRDAIEARGLFYPRRGISGGVYFSEIAVSGDSETFKGYSPSSAAHALLLAYIAYLEALAT